MKILGLQIPFTNITNKTEIVPVESYATKGGLFPTEAIPYETTLSREKQNIATWRSALINAESIHYPNRTELYRCYKDTMIDAHVTSVISTRKNALLSSDFIVVDKTGKEVEEKTKLLHSKWFYDFIELSLDSIFYGHSLIQFDNLINDQFIGVDLVPRQYVKPELNLITPNTSEMKGKSYLEDPYKDWLIGVGSKRDLGLLMKITPLVLWKKQALTSWAEYVSTYGIPSRLGKTDVRDTKTRNLMVSMLRDMGSSGFAVVDKEDEVTIMNPSNASGQDMFDKLIERCNSEISKLVLGQTGTTDEKSFVGSAKVHEKIMHQYNESDERLLMNVLNNQLIDLLNKHGLGFEGLLIKIEEDNDLTVDQKFLIDSKLMEFYDIDPKYILETYGTPVIKKSGVTNVTNSINGFDFIEDELKNLYDPK